MKAKPPQAIEQYRIKKGPLTSDASYGNNGVFLIPGPEGATLKVIVSDGEQWIPISGYEELYEVSNHGGVRALPATRIMNGVQKKYKLKNLRPGVNWAGYKRVPLYKNGERKQTLVHRLVAEAFILNPNNYKVVNHRNANKGYNHALNLEWCTREYNDHHAIENGHKDGFKTSDIKAIKSMFDSDMTIKQIAEKYGKHISTISDYIFGRHRDLNPETPSRYNGLDVFWDHVSVSRADKTPSWEETCFIKDLFFMEDETVIQYHPAKGDYVNFHAFCLHMWRPQILEIPTPPKIMVG